MQGRLFSHSFLPFMHPSCLPSSQIYNHFSVSSSFVPFRFLSFHRVQVPKLFLYFTCIPWGLNQRPMFPTFRIQHTQPWGLNQHPCTPPCLSSTPYHGGLTSTPVPPLAYPASHTMGLNQCPMYPFLLIQPTLPWGLTQHPMYRPMLSSTTYHVGS